MSTTAINMMVNLLRTGTLADLPVAARKKLQALGAPKQTPLTTQDIIDYLKNPLSLLRQTVRAFIYEAWIVTQVAAALEIIFYLEQQMQELLSAWKTQLTELGSTNEEEEEEKAEIEYYITKPRQRALITASIAQTKTDFANLTVLKEDLANSQKELSVLEGKRNALLVPCLNEWKEQQTRQVETFKNDFNKSLGEDKHYELNEKDVQALLNVRKATQIQLTHPELIPTTPLDDKANPDIEQNNEQVMAAAESKASNMFELTCCSRLLQKDDFNPDKENIKPSDLVKLLSKKVDGGNSTIADKMTAHMNKCSTEDKKLASEQRPKINQLRTINTNIADVRCNVEKTNEEILRIHDRLENNEEQMTNLKTPHPQQQAEQLLQRKE